MVSPISTIDNYGTKMHQKLHNIGFALGPEPKCAATIVAGLEYRAATELISN
jgi:hypothetical protein